MKYLTFNTLSSVFHPLFLPSYLFYIICYQLPGLILWPALPERWLVLALVFGFTFLLPTLSTLALYWFGLVDSVLLRERGQRPLPLLVSSITFGTVASVLYQRPAFDPLLGQMMAGMAGAVFVTFLISLWWKISAHGVGVGGALGLFLLLHLTSTSPAPGLVWWLVGSVLVAGAVLTARLGLNAHTPAQAWAGLGLGIALALLISLAVS